MRILRSHHFLIPLLALLATMPLIVHGCSCGHDQPFHVQSWLDAAQQFRQGTIYPRWAFSPAWQAGEPRFIFYPPLSWFLGAALSMLFPMNAVPVIFTWIAFTAAGFSMHHLASRFASPGVAVLCAGVYLANPYMLFNAFERGAYAELLAATWIPLVMLSVIAEKPTIPRVAVPLGLAWLTNAPAGVMATYTLLLMAIVRIAWEWKQGSEARDEAYRERVRFVITMMCGMVLGLLLVSFYLLPAAYERRYVQVAMAVIPNLRYQDNFLFSKTDYIPHNEITFSVSILAITLLFSALAATILGYLRSPSERAEHTTPDFSRRVSVQLLSIVVVIGFLLTPVSSFVWEHLPNLKYLQFPWRLQSILSAVLAFALVPLFAGIRKQQGLLTIASAVIVLLLSQRGSRLYRQGCDAGDYPRFEAALFHSGHGVLPTDEYTPIDADNDVQRTDNPGYWLIQGDPDQPAPGTIANPNETNTNYDQPIPLEDTSATRAPMNVSLTLATPETLILNLRDYPAWRVTRNSTELPAHIHRDDGLVAIALPAGKSIIDVRWVRSWDQNAGIALSLGALIALVFLLSRSRRIEA